MLHFVTSWHKGNDVRYNLLLERSQKFMQFRDHKAKIPVIGSHKFLFPSNFSC